MKSIVLLCAVVTIVSADQVKFQPAHDRLQTVIDKFAKPCVKEGADVNVLVAQLADAALPRDDPTNEFLYCFAKNAGYVNEDGHANPEGIAGILGKSHPLYEEMKESINKCNEITKENHIQTVIAMNDCIAQTAPVRFVFTL